MDKISYKNLKSKDSNIHPNIYTACLNINPKIICDIKYSSFNFDFYFPNYKTFLIMNKNDNGFFSFPKQVTK